MDDKVTIPVKEVWMTETSVKKSGVEATTDLP